MLMPGRKYTVKVLGEGVSLPPAYEPIDDFELNPYDSELNVVLGAETPNAICTIALTPTPPEDAMPYDDPQHLLDYIRDALTEDQGLIEIETGRTEDGHRYIYSIVKSRLEAEDGPFPVVTYTLNLNADYRDFALSIFGMFQEEFTTGVRHAIGSEMIARAKGLPISSVEWFRDPYDPGLQGGFLMHLAEDRMLDGMFPDHPLSQARYLVSFFAENN